MSTCACCVPETTFVLLAALIVLALAASGCTGSQAAPDETGESAPNGDDTTSAGFVEGPLLTPNPNPSVPLAAIVRAKTTEPAVIQLTIDDGETARVVVPDDTPATDHETPLLGLRPDHTYTVRVEAIDSEGNATAAPDELTFTTPSLPAGLPPITVTRAAVEGRSEPGVTPFGVSYSTEAQSESRSYLVILDAQGEIVWYYNADIAIADARRLRNGNLLFLHTGTREMREIDMLGNTVAEWTATGYDDELPVGAIPIDTDSLHHEIYELPDSEDADFLALSSELRTYPDYPASETDPSETEPESQVMGDVVAAFRRDGTVVQEWSLLDILDPHRIDYDSLNADWQLVYGDEDTRDWSHANAVIPDPSDGGLIVSLRNQDAVVKIAPDGELVWILGPHERWQEPWSDALLTPTAPDGAGGPGVEWNYHQNAPMLTPDGNLLLFDNGNARAVPPDPELDPESRYSRVVEYHIDETAATVTETWAYGGPDDPWYSGALGDADYLPESGNVLVVDGFELTDDGQRHARIFEVTRTDPGEIVWEGSIRDETGDPPVNWTVYRAERLPSVYP